MKKVILFFAVFLLVAGNAFATGSVEITGQSQHGQKHNVEAITRNRLAMKAFETMINTADLALAEQLVDSKASFYTPASPEPLYGGKGYLSVVHFMRKGFSNVQWKLMDMVAEPDKVAVKWQCTGTHDGAFLGLAPTGKTFSACVMNFYYFNEEGKITNDVAAEGMIAILRTLGLCNY